MISKRDITLDMAKMIAIIAIVFGHVWRGLNSAGLIFDTALFNSIDTAVYMWHLSVFAFAAGLFVKRGMQRDGVWRYAWSRNATFLWLYIVWSLIQGLTRVLLGGYTNREASVAEVLNLLQPEGQLWFFGWILAMMILSAVTRPWASRRRSVLMLLAGAVFSLILWGVNGPFFGTQGMGLTFFFLSAVVLGAERVLSFIAPIRRGTLLSIWAISATLCVTLSVYGVATPPTSGGVDRTVLSVLLGVAASLAGVIAVLAVSKLLAGVKFVQPIALIGRESLVIFLAHIIFASGTRILLTRFGLYDVTLHVLLGTTAGVVGPLIIWTIANRIRCGWLFAAPAWLSKLTAGKATQPSRQIGAEVVAVEGELDD